MRELGGLEILTQISESTNEEKYDNHLNVK